jgi:hypothetical protein
MNLQFFCRMAPADDGKSSKGEFEYSLSGTFGCIAILPPVLSSDCSPCPVTVHSFFRAACPFFHAADPFFRAARSFFRAADPFSHAAYPFFHGAYPFFHGAIGQTCDPL